MKHKTFIIIFSIALSLVLLVFYVESTRQTEKIAIAPVLPVVTTTTNSPENESLFSLREKEFDFGKIKQSGGVVRHEFIVNYNGKTPVKITGVPTSCGCTTAKINKNILNPGETAIISVEFDPNFHQEPTGKFFKSVIILTEPAMQTPPELKIWAQVDIDLGKDAYKDKTPDND